MNIAGMSHWYDREQNIMEKQQKNNKNNKKTTSKGPDFNLCYK
jgi:hypothetical protein